MANEKAQKIDKVPVKMGRLIKVKNTLKPKFSNANDELWAVQVEDANGKRERCILLTDNELKRAEYRASKNKEDLTTKGFFADTFD